MRKQNILKAKVNSMANMSYCKFENTLDDLEECRGEMTHCVSVEDMDLSESELSALHQMVECCSEIVEMYENMIKPK